MAKRKSTKERFDALFDIDSFTTCWLWTGYINQDGYGVISINAWPHLAHRLAWELHIGPIPDGKHVLHICDVRNCVNPAHMYLGTNADNMRDKKIRNRSASGERNGSHKLSLVEVNSIRELLERGVDGETIAQQFNITRQNVWHIKHYKTWAR